MNFGKQLKEGVITNNPVLVQILGMCPTLAVSTSLFNGIGMGICATLVLMCSNLVISLLRNIIPNKVRIAAFIVVIVWIFCSRRLSRRCPTLWVCLSL